jgi:AcrR family transcriptional regulator
MIQSDSSMAVSELSRLSGIPLSTIKFYIRKNLLPKPIKTKKTNGIYTLKHLDRLILIKKIQKEGQIPLSKIKEIIKMIDLGEEREKEIIDFTPLDKKSDIIDSAIPLFREKGYDAVTITDIVNASSIARATFYKHFINKKDLFFKCIHKILFIEAMNPEAETIENENDIMTVFNKHAEALTKTTPLWKDMINMLRAAAINNPDEFSEKLEEAMCLKMNLYKRRIKKGISRGVLRKVNPDVLAVIILGIQEYCSDYFPNHQSNNAKSKELLEDVKDIMLHGILKK